MRKVLLLLLCQLVICNTNGQNAFGLKSDSKWKVDKLVNVISRKDQRSNGDESYMMFIKDDTIISGLKYFKIYKTGTLYLDTPLEYTNKYCGAAREEGAKVFYIEQSKSGEELLYDYSLKVGNIVQGRIAKGTTVIKIDTLSDGRKRFYLTKSMLHAMDATIIEGVGSFGGLLNDPPVGHYMWNDSYLVCYKENGQVAFSGIDYFDSGCDSKLSRFPINPDASWYISYVSNCSPEVIENGDDIFKYHIIGDTSISNQKYYKLYKSGMAFYNTYFYYNNVYVGALRDENNKFFYVEKDKSSEEMLYDFDLNVGDAIKTGLGKGYPITKIDTLPDGRRRLKYQAEVCAGCCPEDEFIEGIGHWGGIMQKAPCLHPCATGYYLLCYKENDKLIYSHNFDGMFKNGCGPLSVPDIHEAEAILSPIPVGDILTIEINKPEFSNYLVTIFDIDGHPVISKYVKSDTKKTELNVSCLNKGFYLIRINGNKSSITQKMIKK